MAARGYKPTKASDRSEKSNLFAAGHNDPILKRYLGEKVLAKLSGRKPAQPANNFEAARDYFLSQQKSKTSKARS